MASTLRTVARVAPSLLRRELSHFHPRTYRPLSLYTLSTYRPTAPFLQRLYSTKPETASSKTCLVCGSSQNLLQIACGKCGSLLPLPEDINYLSLFGLPDKLPFSLEINPAALRERYLKLMSQVHPDVVGDKAEEQKRVAESLSSTITHAYSTLQRPLSRAEYLLHHLDPPVPVTESSKLSDPKLLMAVLDTREEIEEATSQEEVDRIRAQNQGKVDAAYQALVEAFRQGDAEAARDKTIEYRYWLGLTKACDDWEPGKRVELVHE